MLMQIPIHVTEPLGIDRARFPVTRGVPLPEGTAREPLGARLTDARGRPVPLQTRSLSHWPDGSVKWLLLDFQTDVPAGGRSVYTLAFGAEAGPAPEAPLVVEEDARAMTVCTGT